MVGLRPSISGLLFLFSLALRLFYLHEMKEDPFFQRLIMDSEFYDGWAQEIARGNWVGGSTAFYQDPLYAYFLAALYKIFGHHLFLVRVIQAILDSLSGLLLFFIGKISFGAPVGLVAMALYGLYPVAVVYTGLLDKTTFSVFLVTIALFSLTRAWKSPSRRSFLLGGFLFGLSALTRGNLLLLAPLMAGAILFIFRDAMRRAGGFCLLFLAGLALPVFFVSARNAVVSRDFVLITANAGLNFYIGNNPFTTGAYTEPPFLRGNPQDEIEDSRRFAQRLSQKKMEKPSEISGFWFFQGLQFARHKTRMWLALMFHKFLLFWKDWETVETYSYSYFKERIFEKGSALSIPFAIFSFGGLFSLALTGAVLKIKLWREHILLYLFIAGYALSVMMFFVTSRYRLPIVPAMLLFASSALVWIKERVVLRQYLSVFLISVFVLASYAFSKTNTRTMEIRILPADRSTPHAILGALYLDEGNVERAIGEFERSLRINPWASAVNAQLGMCYSKKGELGRAIYFYERAIRLDPFLHEAHFNSGVLYGRLGKMKQALSAYEKALKIYPENEIYQRAYEMTKKSRRSW